MRYPVVSGLCLIAKETEQEVTMTLFYYLNINVTKFKEQGISLEHVIDVDIVKFTVTEYEIVCGLSFFF